MLFIKRVSERSDHESYRTSECQRVSDLVDSFTDDITKCRERKRFVPKEELNTIRKQESDIYNLLSKTIKDLIINTELYSLSHVILSYVMDPVMWNIKHRISECIYARSSFSNLIINYEDNNYVSILDENSTDKVSIFITGYHLRIQLNKWTFPCKIRELTEGNCRYLAKAKDI